MNPTIITTIDPREIRANYSRVSCQDGEFSVIAYAEILNESFDKASGKYKLFIGLDYPRRGTHTTVSLAIPARQDGKTVAIAPPKYWMTQEDFDGMLKGLPVKVPTHV